MRSNGICCRIAAMQWDDPPPVHDAFTLLKSIVSAATSDGLFYGEPRGLRSRLGWNQPHLTADHFAAWLAQLEEWGDVVVKRADDCYGGTFAYAEVCNRTRFRRWRARRSFTNEQREEVYTRDGHQCRWCGSTINLSVDHIIPWSKGGEHTMDNFQTLCRSCNSRKGARVG